MGRSPAGPYGFANTTNGSQFGILQTFSNTVSSLSQTISVATAGYASFAFRGQGRPSYGSAGIELVIDGTTQSTWPASAFTPGAWGDYISQPVSLTAGTHTLQFRSMTNAIGDVATAIDAIKVNLPGLTGSSYDLQNGTVSANLGGSAALAKTGSGTVTLSGTNTSTGGVTINGGVLALGSAGALGTTGTISFGGGTLQYSASNTTDYTARFSTAANQAYSVDTNGQNVAYAGALISSGGSLRKVGAGTLTLTGSNTHTGGTFVTGGVLASGANNVLPDAGAITVNGGTLALGTYSDTVGAVSLLAGSITSTTGILTGSGYSAQNGTVSAILAGTGVLAKTGSSTDTVTLTGENIYTGGTTINGGVLALGSVGALGTIGTISFGGGTLQHSAGNVTDYTARFSTAANQAVSVDTNGQNVTYAGALVSSGGSLTKAGTGTLTLTGTNTYTGGTTLSGGVLSLGSAGALGTTGTISFGGGTLQYTSANTTDYSARFSTAAVQNFLIDTGTQNISFATALASSGGTLTKTGTGKLTLAGDNQFTAPTTFNGTSDYLSLPSTGYDNFTAGFSAAVWAKPTSNGSWARFFDLGAGAGIGNVLLCRSGTSNNLAFVIYNQAQGATTNVVVSNVIENNVWQHFAVTMTSSGTVTIYKNGVAVGTATGQPMPVVMARPNNYIGKSNWSADALFSGSMADGQIWNTALTGTEITSVKGGGEVQTQARLASFASRPVTRNNFVTGPNTPLTISAGTVQIGNDAGTSGAFAGNILNNGTLVFNRADATSHAGGIGGTGALEKRGSGTLTISGANTYTGGTAITGGVLALGSTGALGTAGTISFGGGTLQYSASNTTDYSGRFSTAANQAYSVDTNGQNVTYASALGSSGGSLRKSGAGTLTLTGTNTYTGDTIVVSSPSDRSILRQGAPGAIPSGPGKGNLIVDGFVDAGSFDLFANNLSGSGEIWYQESLIVSGDVTGSLHVRSIVLEPTAVYRPQVVFPAPGDPPTTNVLTTYYSAGLGGARLEVSIEGSAAVGQSVTILVNHAEIPANGTFSGLSEGAVFLASNGQTFQISYAGGDGNDIVVTRVLVGLTVSGIAVESRPYDGGTIAPLNLVQATLAGLVPGDLSTTLVTVGATGAYGDPNAGSNKPVTVTGLSLTGALADNYYLQTPDVLGTIAKAQTSIQGPASVVYSGYGQRGVVVGYGINGENLGTAFTNETVTDAGVYFVTWLFVSPDLNYDDASGDGTFTVEQADPTINVVPFVTTYDGQAHFATGTVTGVLGEDLSSGLDLAFATAHVNAGVYNDSWTFSSPNSNYRSTSGSITNTILRATPSITVTPYNVTDDRQAHSVIGVATGVNGEDLSSGLNLQGTTHIDPGTYVDRWYFISPNPNYADVDPGEEIVNTILPGVIDAPIVALGNDTGTSDTDGITSDGALAVTGVEIGNGIEYSLDYGQTWSGAFQAAEGGNVVLVRQFDGRGRVSTATPFEFTLDTRRPVAPVTMLANDTGSSPIDRVTSDGTLTHEATLATLFGTGVDAAGQLAANWATDLHYTLVSLPGGSDVVRVATADNGYPIGAWISATGASSWIGPASDDVLNGPGGQYVYRTTFDLTGIDPASVSISGMWAADDFGVEILINGMSEGYATWNSPGYWSFETFTVTGGFVDGINTLDFVLVNGGGPTGLRVEMTGAVSTIELDGTVEYSTDNGSTWRTQWTPEEGLNQVLLRQVDPAGNASDPTSFEFTLDTQVAAPTVALTSDTGTDRTDLITSVADLTIGNVESGATVEYSVDWGTSWSTSFSAVEGMNVLEVRQVDVGGNVSPATHFEFTLDTSPLTVVLFYDGFGTLMPDGINATTTLDFSACTVPLTFTLHPNGSLTVEDTTDPSANGLTFGSFGDIVGGQTENRFVFDGSAAMAGRVIGNAMAINTLDYSASSLAVSVDLGLGLATLSGGFEGINAVIGSAANGNAGGNTLIGPGGGSVWTIESTGGGSVGGVVFSGINDLVAVASSDTLDYSLFASAVTVNLALGAATGFRQISGFRNVVGTLFDDTLVGDASDNTFSGLSGDDRFDGGAGTDTVVESADVNFTLTAAGLTGLGTDSLASIEAVSLSAGASANTFTVDGWTGSAMLTGGAGNDSYVFVGTESASVTIVEGADADTDTLDFAGLLNGGVSLDLAAATAQLLVSGLTLKLSSVTGIENVIGTALADALLGNSRDNSFSGLGGDDTFTGLSGNDTFLGGAGTDTVIESADVNFMLTAAGLFGIGTDLLASIEGVNLSAGASANTFTVDGWTGSATLTGGAGNDSYAFVGTESASVTIVESANTDTDTLDFTGLLNGGVSLDLAVATAQPLVSGLTLKLSSVTGIENVIGTALADALLGNSRDNSFTGLAGNDTFLGLSGDDRFDGGAGTDTVVESADVDFTLTATTLAGIGAGASANTFTVDGWTGSATLTGGAGNDSYAFVGTESASVTIVEGANTDTDTLDFSGLLNGGVSLDLAATAAQTLASGLTLTLSSATGIENVIGTALDDTLLGNSRDNSFTGLAGNDTVAGLSGDDRFDGGAGTDTVVESADVDFTLTATTLAGIGTDSLASIETVNLSSGASANTFTVTNWTGSVILTGGAGNDSYVFVGTTSASVTIVEVADADTDTLDFSGLLNGGVSLDLAVATTQALALGLTLKLSSVTGIENVIGTALADTLLGNGRDNSFSGLAGDDTLVGRGGDDTFIGSAGNDSFDGGTGTDTVIESADVDFTLASTTLTGLGTDTLAGIERVNLTADASANTITLQGWSGSATLTGGTGNDRYVFAGAVAANVTIVEGASADTDTLDFTALASGGVSVDLASTAAQAIVSGLTLTFSSETGIENVIGTAFADVLIGNARDNVLSGLAGDDTLSGRLGNDTVDGGSGTDTIAESGDVDFTLTAAGLVGRGTDSLAGIEAVSLTGGAGANTLTVQGWTGNASLTGGAGNDSYVFVGTESASVTIVESADADTDTLDFTNLTNGGVTIDLAATTAQALASGLTLTLSTATGI
ncbi:MAG: autotransporter-associated beta strand repeat-containing protein [Planctomycetota bacterium]|nr:autotransporter-associated beta strand repeat-containing protein [Planctomycetota bacterium]